MRYLAIAAGLIFSSSVFAASKPVMLCTGMSNAMRICSYWKQKTSLKDEYTIINGARSGWDYYAMAYKDSSTYWAAVAEQLSQQGLTFEDVDVVWNLNTLAYKHGPERNLSSKQRLDDLTTGIVDFQAEAESIMPNLKAGYHLNRSSGQWCNKSPQEMVTLHGEAIARAISGSKIWHFGPDLSIPHYVSSDFRDGCHPSTAGKAKMYPVIEDFFTDLQSPPRPPPACRMP